MTDPEIVVDDADGTLLIGVDTDGLSASACLGADADVEDVADAMHSLECELRHSARLNRRGSA